jgi:hypothetical protein
LRFQPVSPQVSRRQPSSPHLTMNSRTAGSLENHASSAETSVAGYGTTDRDSRLTYWSELETPEEAPFTVPITESTGLLWRTKRRGDLEANDEAGESIVTRGVRKWIGKIELEVRTSKEGLTALFYEKGLQDGELDSEEEYSSDESSPETRPVQQPSAPSREELLNRGYILCVAICSLLAVTLGLLGAVISSTILGLSLILIGSLFSLTLEIVSLVRFFMSPPPILTANVTDK